MKCLALFLAATLAVVGCASLADAAVDVLYEQTFNPTNDPNGYDPNNGTEIEDSGWSLEYLQYQGTYSGNFAPLNMLVDARTNQPINGNTGVFIGIGGPVTQARGMFYVTDGSGGFTTIDPAQCDRLFLTIYANTQAGGEQDFGYFAVQLGDGDPRTGDEAWYIATSPMVRPGQNQGNLMNLRALEYDPSPGNWASLTLGPPTPGAVAGDLSGLLITGVGVVMEITNPAPLPDFSNPDAFGSWNFADYRILCVPEPSLVALVTLAGCMMSVICPRRR